MAPRQSHSRTGQRSLMRFEQKHEPVAGLGRFSSRLAMFLFISGGIVATALSIGILGYHYIARLGWIDSVLNASMILTGMGPVNQLDSSPAKLFASAYALFSGLVFITAMAVTLSPVLHRIIHKFHFPGEDLDK